MLITQTGVFSAESFLFLFLREVSIYLLLAVPAKMRFMSRQIETSSVLGACRSVRGHFRRQAAGDLASGTKQSSSVTVSAQKLHVTAESNTTVREDEEITSTSIREKRRITECQ